MSVDTDALCGAAKYGEVARANFREIVEELAHAIHDNEAGEISAITEVTTPASDDVLLLERASDSYNKKRVALGNLPRDTRSYAGTWTTTSSVTFSPRQGQPTTVRNKLSDGKQRSKAGSLVWAIANGVADLGYDEAGSQGNSKFLYFYEVPETGNDEAMTIVASDNPPSTGPTGRSAFKHVWTAYVDGSGEIVKQVQVGNRIKYVQRRRAVSLTTGSDGSPVQASLTSFIPLTACAVEILLYYQAYGTAGSVIVWVSGEQGTGGDNARWYTRASVGDNTFGSDGVHALVPTPGAKEIYYQRTAGSNIALIDVVGYVDESLEN